MADFVARAEPQKKIRIAVVKARRLVEVEEAVKTLSEVFAIPEVYLEVGQRSSSLMDALSVAVVVAAAVDQRNMLVAECAD